MEKQDSPSIADVKLTDFTHGFVNSPEKLIDNVGATIAQRYEMILLCLPEARRTPLHGDFEAAFHRVYATGTRNETAAAIDLNRLRVFFFMTLYNNSIGRSHTNIWHAANAEKWLLKLTERFRQTEHDVIDRDAGTFTPPKFPEKVTHTWLN
jgi:hypothetical protein